MSVAGPQSKGRLIPVRSNLTTSQRFWSKVDKDGPVPDFAPHLGRCWIWTSAGPDAAYCRFWVNGEYIGVYRWAYEQEYGPIPAHLQCDHLCRVPRCVRPSHITAVSTRVNTLRGFGPTALNARKTHCLNGHRFDQANTYKVPSGGRECRTCRVAYQKTYQRHPKDWAAAGCTTKEMEA